MNNLLIWLLENAIATALLAAVVLVACRGLRNRPALVHALWLVVLVKFVTPPLVSWPWPIAGFAGAFGDPPADDGRQQARATRDSNINSDPSPRDDGKQLPSVAASQEEAALLDGLADRIRELPQADGGPAADFHDATSGVPPTLHQSDASESGARDLPLATTFTDHSQGASAEFSTRRGEFVPPLLLGCLIAGGMVVVLCQIRGILNCRKLIMRAEPAPDQLESEIRRLAQLIGIAPIPARVSREIDSPFVWCCLRPRLLWPAKRAGRDDVERLRAVIAHELAHVRRRDHLVAWLVMIAGVVWWWNPLFWFVRRRLHDAAESACDAVALRIVPDDRRVYAQTLLELSSNFPVATPAPLLGVSAGARHSFHRRLTMILSDRVSDRLSRGSLLAVAALMLAAAPSWSLGQADKPLSNTPAAAPPVAAREIAPPPVDQPLVTPPALTAPVPAPPKSGDPLSSAEPRNLEDRLQRVERALDRILERLENPKPKVRVPEVEMPATAPNEPAAVARDPNQTPRHKPSTIARPALPSRAYTVPSADPSAANPPAATAQSRPFNPFAVQATSFPATPSVRAEQLDLVSLGTSYIEANGAVRLAEARHKRLQANEDAVTRGELDAAQIELETARQKLELLGTIARIALEATQAELAAAKTTLERSIALRDSGVVTHDETAQAEAAFAAVRARLQVLESILSKTGGGAGSTYDPAPIDPDSSGAANRTDSDKGTRPSSAGTGNASSSSLDAPFTPMRVGDLTIAVDQSLGALIASDTATSKTVWMLRLKPGVEEVEAIQVADGRIAIATVSGRVMIVDAKTGRIEREAVRQ